MFFHEFRKKKTVQSLEKIMAKHHFAPYIPKPQSLLYVAANCLPYHISGYTTRTHELLMALQHEGIHVHALTRAGYPWDHAPTACKAGPLMTYYQGLTYYHVKHPRKLLSLTSFVEKAAHTIVEQAKKHQAACIHAASNYVNALPALVAARWLNIPFQYEMRGHWELSRKAQRPAYEKSYSYAVGMHLEHYLAHNADRVFCISKALANFVHLEIDQQKVYLLPNCVDCSRIYPQEHQEVTPYHIGYAGALVQYEGLDVLLYAMKELVSLQKKIVLHIIGDGKEKENLLDLSQRLGLQEHVHFYGKLSPEEARAYLESCALVCIPRAPLDVCTMVPPIKLVEAMALGKTVVLPDLPVFQEEAHKVPAFFFEAGNAKHLAQVLEEALNNTEDLIQRGQQCRKHVLEHRQWKHFLAPMTP